MQVKEIHEQTIVQFIKYTKCTQTSIKIEQRGGVLSKIDQEKSHCRKNDSSVTVYPLLEQFVACSILNPP